METNDINDVNDDNVVQLSTNMAVAQAYLTKATEILQKYPGDEFPDVGFSFFKMLAEQTNDIDFQLKAVRSFLRMMFFKSLFPKVMGEPIDEKVDAENTA